MTGKKLSEVFQPELRSAGVEEIFERVAATGVRERCERFAEGFRRWYFISAYSHERGTFVASLRTSHAGKRLKPLPGNGKSLLSNPNWVLL